MDSSRRSKADVPASKAGNNSSSVRGRAVFKVDRGKRVFSRGREVVSFRGVQDRLVFSSVRAGNRGDGSSLGNNAGGIPGFSNVHKAAGSSNVREVRRRRRNRRGRLWERTLRALR